MKKQELERKVKLAKESYRRACDNLRDAAKAGNEKTIATAKRVKRAAKTRLTNLKDDLFYAPSFRRNAAKKSNSISFQKISIWGSLGLTAVLSIILGLFVWGETKGNGGNGEDKDTI
jgi:hypothetical protein